MNNMDIKKIMEIVEFYCGRGYLEEGVTFDRIDNKVAVLDRIHSCANINIILPNDKLMDIAKILHHTFSYRKEDYTECKHLRVMGEYILGYFQIFVKSVSDSENSWDGTIVLKPKENEPW